ncbi:uncharacterized protein [Rutidosis leptorrhynchoides]|uniref:uncharacterized protein n=1 Tax=Rutidosis leptorrhynchoides TaxID=125765 RepID=UPI003A99F743
MLDVIENGPWMIRTAPIILNKWAANVSLTKEDLTKVLVWVKLHDIPLTGYTEDALSKIASKISKPIMLDSYTSTMCIKAWGHPNYARAMIEISANKDLKKDLTVATSGINGASCTIDTVTVEYEWKPPRCSGCNVFGHGDLHCPKNISVPVATKIIDNEGFQTVKVTKATGHSNNSHRRQNDGFIVGKKTQKMVYRPKKNVDQDGNTSGVQGMVGTVDKQVKEKKNGVPMSNTYDALDGIEEDVETNVHKLVDEASDIESEHNETIAYMVPPISEGESTPGVDGHND